MARLFTAYNGAAPTTAAITPVATGTAIKTLLQLSTPSTKTIEVIEWGISFDGTTANTPVRVELIETDVAATVTAHVAAGLVKLNSPSDEASLLTLGTANTGFTASVEGTTAASRMFDYQQVAPTNQYIKQYPLGSEPVLAVSKFLRVRVTAGTTVNAICYITWRE